MSLKWAYLIYFGLAFAIVLSPGCKKKTNEESTGSVQLRMQEVH